MMHRHIQELWTLRSKLNETYPFRDTGGIPILIAGDVFNKWNAPAELINRIGAKMPNNCWAIPGQHDLPNHRLDKLEKSAYRTFCMVGSIINMVHARTFSNYLTVHPFPWEVPFHKNTVVGKAPGMIHMALVHRYCWQKGHGHPGALEEDNVENLSKELHELGYDCAVFGDNHEGFHYDKGPIPIFNCGTFMRRRSDEMGYDPRVGILMSDGKFTTHYQECASEDNLLIKEEPLATTSPDFKEFVRSLFTLGEQAYDFSEHLRKAAGEKKYAPDLLPRAKQMILNILEGMQ